MKTIVKSNKCSAADRRQDNICKIIECAFEQKCVAGYASINQREIKVTTAKELGGSPSNSHICFLIVALPLGTKEVVKELQTAISQRIKIETSLIFVSADSLIFKGAHNQKVNAKWCNERRVWFVYKHLL